MELTAGGTQINIVARVVVDASLGKHGIVLNLRLANGRAVVRDDDQLSLKRNGENNRG